METVASVSTFDRLIWGHNLVSNCAHTLHALRVLRDHDMRDSALQTIYQSVIIAKLLYVSGAWRGFTYANDRRFAAPNRSSATSTVHSTYPQFEEQCTAADRKLFDQIQSDVHHLLYDLHPPTTAVSQN